MATSNAVSKTNTLPAISENTIFRAVPLKRRILPIKENDKAIGCENRIIRASRDGRYFRQFRKTVFCLDRFATYYLPDVSVGIASNGDSKAMKSTQAAPLAHLALCGCIAGP